jgi:hypothetical protein
MNAVLCLLKLSFFNSNVCQPEYIVQLGLLRDSTGIKCTCVVNCSRVRLVMVTNVSVLCETSDIIRQFVNHRFLSFEFSYVKLKASQWIRK